MRFESYEECVMGRLVDWNACQEWLAKIFTTVASRGWMMVGTESNDIGGGVVIPSGLRAFCLYLSVIGLWGIRRKRMRLVVLQRASAGICIVLLIPCVYGLCGAWLNVTGGF